MAQSSKPARKMSKPLRCKHGAYTESGMASHATLPRRDGFCPQALDLLAGVGWTDADLATLTAARKSTRSAVDPAVRRAGILARVTGATAAPATAQAAERIIDGVVYRKA